MAAAAAGVDAAADALVWLDPADLDGLRRALGVAVSARWIQLPIAGVERVAAAGILDPERAWTSAKGAYAEPVAEHALALALAGLRSLRQRIMARWWGEPAGQSLYDEPVTILGGGGVAASLLELLAPFRVAATVVRRGADPVRRRGAHAAAGKAARGTRPGRVVFLALALTPGTEQIIGSAELAVIDPAHRWSTSPAGDMSTPAR